MTGRGWGDLALEASSGGQRFALTWKTRIRLSRRSRLFEQLGDFVGVIITFVYIATLTDNVRAGLPTPRVRQGWLCWEPTRPLVRRVKNCQYSGAQRERKLPCAK